MRKIPLSSLSLAKIVELYNALSDRPVKKFSDRDTAERRLQKLMDTEGCYVGEDKFLHDLDDTVSDERRRGAGRGYFSEDQVIEVLAPCNPKRARSKAHQIFALYRTGMTVGEFLDRAQALQPDKPRFRQRADLCWNVDHGHIRVVNPAQPTDEPTQDPSPTTPEQ